MDRLSLCTGSGQCKLIGSHSRLLKMTVIYRWPLWTSGRYDRFYCTTNKCFCDILRTDAHVHMTCVCAGSTHYLSCRLHSTARLHSRTSSAMASCSLRKYTASPLGGTHGLVFPDLIHYYSTLHR